MRTFVFPPQGGVFYGGYPANLTYVDPAGHPTAVQICSPCMRRGRGSQFARAGPAGARGARTHTRRTPNESRSAPSKERSRPVRSRSW